MWIYVFNTIETHDRICLLSACFWPHHLLKSDWPIPSVGVGLVGKQIHNWAKKYCSLLVLPETFLFTRETTLIANAYSFSYQRRRGPAFLCQFRLNCFDSVSTSDQRGVGGILPVYPPINASWRPQMKHGCAGESRESVWGLSTLDCSCFLQTQE